MCKAKDIYCFMNHVHTVIDLMLFKPNFKIPHPEHDKHLCVIWQNTMDVEELKSKTKNPKFICKGCGRVAEQSSSLCDAVPM